ncbi:MAG TPA: aminotransferase class I/II-fold pyridoxal phosphate-dependent enzyme [Rhizomicrobium sp.]|nr:aminotransferase class I/II-fold pyridoxal phosphate-dependent enzyme [Rhizomicrobium sp.]
MTHLIRPEIQDDLLSRGYSRRQMFRTAMMLAGGAAALSLNSEMAFAADDDDARMIRIGSNECWTGPMAPGLAAGNAAFVNANRYSPNGEHEKLIKAISTVENVPVDHIGIYPGSGETLTRTLVAFCSPTKGLVQASPTYDNPTPVAKYLNVPIANVALTSDYRHDVKAMAAANPNAGVFYVVNPNNPTGTMTPMSEIEWLVDNKPAGAVVLIDEAYIHWTPEYPKNSAAHLVRAGKDVIITRTFSKVFGMAGARVGYVMARPDLVKKVEVYDRGNGPSIPTAACATASITQTALIAARRNEMIQNRAMTVDFLTKRGMKVIGPSFANMIMVDWKTKSAKDMNAMYKAQGIQIAGNRWPVWPTVGRVSIGSKADMEAFINASGKILT